MSKKIRLSVPIEVVVRNRDAKLLETIDRMSAKSGTSVVISLPCLSRELDISLDTLRRAITSCQEEGYLHVGENYLSNGARLANSYTLTPDGIALAKAARTSDLVA